MNTNPAGLSDQELAGLKAKFPAGGFKIDPDSEVTSGSHGHLFCTTTPVHPDAMKLSDRNKRYIYVHRVVMENHLKRLLNPDKEEVHHKNDNPEDNRLSNLQLLSQEGHATKEEFWKHSPRTKPGQKRKAHRVITAYMNRLP